MNISLNKILEILSRPSAPSTIVTATTAPPSSVTLTTKPPSVTEKPVILEHRAFRYYTRSNT
ncbi:MAG: hypothetical protein ACP5UG_07155, partial [Thermoplasmata archaeon]